MSEAGGRQAGRGGLGLPPALLCSNRPICPLASGQARALSRTQRRSFGFCGSAVGSSLDDDVHSRLKACFQQPAPVSAPGGGTQGRGVESLGSAKEAWRRSARSVVLMSRRRRICGRAALAPPPVGSQGGGQGEGEGGDQLGKLQVFGTSDPRVWREALRVEFEARSRIRVFQKQLSDDELRVQLRETFERFDADGSGDIDRDEVRMILVEQMGEEWCSETRLDQVFNVMDELRRFRDRRAD